jgi:hypothetical protein
MVDSEEARERREEKRRGGRGRELQDLVTPGALGSSGKWKVQGTTLPNAAYLSAIGDPVTTLPERMDVA